MVMNEKNGSIIAPVTYMWWAHTVTDRPAMAIVAVTRPLYPKIGLRENTGIISEVTPKNGRASTYTSGCPKNQKRCCQRTAPPFSGSKIWPPKRRSIPSANSAEASGGKIIIIKMEVISVVHVNTDMRHMVMPGARIATIVVMKFTAPIMVPKPCSARPKTHRSPPTDGL